MNLFFAILITYSVAFAILIVAVAIFINDDDDAGLDDIPNPVDEPWFYLIIFLISPLLSCVAIAILIIGIFINYCTPRGWKKRKVQRIVQERREFEARYRIDHRKTIQQIEERLS